MRSTWLRIGISGIMLMAALAATPVQALDADDREKLTQILAAWSNQASQTSQAAYEAIGTTEYHKRRSTIEDFVNGKFKTTSLRRENLTGPVRLKFVIEPEAYRCLAYGETTSPSLGSGELDGGYVRLRAFDGETATVHLAQPEVDVDDSSRMITHMINGKRRRAFPVREWIIHAALTAHGRTWTEMIFDYEISCEDVIERYNMSIGSGVQGPSGGNCLSVFYNPIWTPTACDEEIHCDVDSDYRIVYRSIGIEGKTFLDYFLRYETNDIGGLAARIRWFETRGSELGQLEKQQTFATRKLMAFRSLRNWDNMSTAL